MSCPPVMPLLRSPRRLLCWIGAISLLSPCLAISSIVLSQPVAASNDVPLTSDSLVRPTLQSGSKGAEVTELQATLKLLGYYDGSIDGVYGMNTVTAVSRFQQAAGLPADGIMGATTWSRLFPPTPALPTATVSSATAFPAPTPTQPIAPATTAVVPSNLPGNPEATLPILRIGMTGSAVTALQERLRAIGVFDGAVDGVFGMETQTAVKTAQQNFSLEPDGVVGAATWSALLRQPQ